MAPRRRLPSLSSLRAFEAAARHGGFRVAAEELNVTHSAISHQVKALEAYLGETLFDRGGRAIALTEAGRILFPVLRDSFDNIVAATELLRRRKANAPLAIQTYVTIASRWLLPRLADYHKLHPSVQVALMTSDPGWDYTRDGVDAALIFPTERHPDLDYTELYLGQLFPVCAPSYLERHGPIETPEALLDETLLSVFPADGDWSRWFSAAGIEEAAQPERWSGQRVSVDNYLLSIEAALAGDGITLTVLPFVDKDLEAGRLVQLFDITVSQPGAWCFVCPKDRRGEPKLEQFLEWLQNAVKADSSMMADLS